MSNDNLGTWMDKWQEAQEKGIFKSAEKQPEVNKQVYSSDYFGNVQEKSSKPVGLNECDAKYWKKIYKLSNNEVVKEEADEGPLGSEPLGKTREVPTEKSVGVKSGELAQTANPVQPPTRGIDAKPRKVTPEWADGKGLRELVDMKLNLYELEVKINKHPKFGAYGPESPEIKKIQSQIDELKSKMDDLSTSLSPDFVQDELS
jgi:hypothetical protein